MFPIYAMTMGATVAAPTLASLNYALADIAGGGQSIIATGTNCASVTAVNIWGTTVAPTATTATTVTFTAPAHAAGSTTVSLTNPGGTSGTLAFESWSPAQVTGVFRYLDSNKGITNTSGKVSAWLDQSAIGASLTQATAALRPAVVASAFGTLPSVQGFAAADGSNQSTLADGTGFAAQNPFSMFAVVKTTGSKSTTTNAGTSVPMAIIGGSGWAGFGMSGGSIAYGKYDTGIVTAGSSLNDGNPHMIGVTCDATPNIKLYKAATQQGATFTPGGTSLNYYDHLMCGYPGGTADGFPGDIGAIVIASQVIAAGDLTKLNAWAQQRFGTT